MEVNPGPYRHFKGNNYIVEDIAIHSETGEQMVVYRACYGDRLLFVRPLSMFTEEVEFEGQRVPRFRPLDKEEVVQFISETLGKQIADIANGFITKLYDK